jgi:hypothetical protein
MTANALLTTQLITNQALALFLNSNAFIRNIDKHWSGEFGRPGAKIGDTLNIRKRADYTVRTGMTAAPQATNEQELSLVVNTPAGVDLQFTSEDLVLSVDQFSERYMETAVDVLAGFVASQIMAGIETGGTAGVSPAAANGFGGVPNIVNNTASGYNTGAATLSPTANTWLNAGAYLDIASCPPGGRSVIMSPFTQANTVSTLSGLFNSQNKISTQYETGMMGADTLGYDKWLSDQTVITHTTAAYSTLATVNGPNQTGSAITVHALAGPLNVGDIISFTGVNFVNRVTKADAGKLATFVITQANSTSDTVVHIYPPITPPSAGNPVQYQTVTNSPADSAPLLSPVAASQVYRKNFVFNPVACTAVFVDLPTNMPGTNSARQRMDGVSMRLLNYYLGATDEDSWRLDVLFGSVWPRPEWACIVTDIS